jgi:hypothetical protein
MLVPAALAGSLLLAAPSAVRAADGLTETGTTTYEVLPASGTIKVQIKVSDYNGKPDSTSGGVNYIYFWNATEIAVETEAGAVSATSNAGAVTQTVLSSDQSYHYVQIGYPDVHYGQTRLVTASYSIPAGPHAPGGFRAVSAYASLCLGGNGYDTGSVSLVIPDGFAVTVERGGALDKTGDAGGKQTYSSGPQSAPYKFWSCIHADNPANLVHTPLTAAGQAFDIQAWPEDAAWSTALQSDLSTEAGSLEGLTGLTLPGGTIDVIEAGDSQLGNYGGTFNSASDTAYVPETIDPATVAHELSHVWFNTKLFNDRWAMEGLAGYSQKAAGAGNYKTCSEPGPYPGTGAPNLGTWLLLANDASPQDVAVSTWQYAASCYIFTSLADLMGADGFRNVLKAAAGGEIAYVGADPNEKLPGAGLPLTAKEVLDLLDERGLIPAGLSGLDTAQTLLSGYGILGAADLAGRSAARATYHALASDAGTWKLPAAVRTPMSNWDFAAATTAMATARQIIDLRDTVTGEVTGLSLDGSAIEKSFEATASQADLDAVLASMQKASAAAVNVASAQQLRNDASGFVAGIGLLGIDVGGEIDRAKADLAASQPDLAAAEAESAADQLRNAAAQGWLRLAAAAISLLILLLLVGAAMALRGRRKRSLGAIGGRPGPWAQASPRALAPGSRRPVSGSGRPNPTQVAPLGAAPEPEPIIEQVKRARPPIGASAVPGRPGELPHAGPEPSAGARHLPEPAALPLSEEPRLWEWSDSPSTRDEGSDRRN